jgi:3-hydroxyacyl-[acyl-carrier-protein] dehydratase
MAAGVTILTIAAEHPAFAGHFPGAPIVPGVLLLDETVRAVEAAGYAAPALWRIASAKFVKPVRPGETLTLEHERLPNGSIAFTIASAGQAVARGVLVPSGAQDTAGDGQQTP